MRWLKKRSVLFKNKVFVVVINIGFLELVFLKLYVILNIVINKL